MNSRPGTNQPATVAGPTYRLVGQRRFGPLFVVQFGGALNDNVLRNALVTMITFGVLSEQVANRAILVQVALGLFMLPFFLFSASAGRFADACPDRALAVRMIKALEIVSMTIAAVGLALGSVTVLLVALFLTGLQSAYFGPFKYALLPDLLAREELIGGNALLNASTYVAILIGIFLGLGLGAAANSDLQVTAVLMVIAVLGYCAALAIPPLPGPAHARWRQAWSWNIVRDMRANFQGSLAVPDMIPLILVISWFWMSGAIVITELPVIIRDAAGFDHNVYLLLLLVVCLGVAAGSLLSAWVLRNTVSTRLVPMGIAIASFGCLLPVFPTDTEPVPTAELGSLMQFLADAANYPMIGTFLGIAMAMGFYIVPLYTTLQLVAPPAERGRMVATNNIFNALFIVVSFGVATVIVSMFQPVGQAIEYLFVMLGFGGFAVAVFGARVLNRLATRAANVGSLQSTVERS